MIPEDTDIHTEQEYIDMQRIEVIVFIYPP